MNKRIIEIIEVLANPLQSVSIFGAKDVVVFDIADERLELGKRLGATGGVNTLEPDFMDKAMALTHGHGYDYVYETAGNTITMNMAFKLAANKAQVCFVGTPTRELKFSVEDWENGDRNGFSLWHWGKRSGCRYSGCFEK